MSKPSAAVIALACFSSVLGFAQEHKVFEQPSKYVLYEVVSINNGKYQIFTKMVSQIRSLVEVTAPDVYWIAGSPVTGESNRIAILTFHDNMASIEKMQAAFAKVEEAAQAKNINLDSQSAEAESSSHWILAEYSEDLSYHPEVVPMAYTTWWLSELLNLKPGCEYEFNDAVKQAADLHSKVADNVHWIAYEIRAGYAQPSILFVTPLRSLADQDEKPPAAARELFDSLLVRQMFEKINKECVERIESTYSRVVPSLSRPPRALIAANPDFWTIKEETPPTATKTMQQNKGTIRPAPSKK
jgi:hypothetical protein